MNSIATREKENAQINAGGYFPALTGLRAIAAYLVYLHHFNPFTPYKLEHGTVKQALFSICVELHIGVAVFFCLSGFLIAHRYLYKVELRVEWLIKYFRNRFARIYPIYFIITAVIFILCWFYPHSKVIGPYNSYSSYKELLLILGLNLTFLRGFSNTVKFSGIAPGWSLTVEETFCFCAPVILWTLTKLKKGAALTLFACLFVSLGVVFVYIFKQRPVLGVMETYKFMWDFTFFGRCFEFLAGVSLALLLRSSNSGKFFMRSAATFIGLILIAVCLYMLVLLNDGSEQSAVLYTKILVNNVLLAVAVCFLLWGLVKNNNFVVKMLASNLMQLLGKSSYVFYLIHVSFISVSLGAWLPDSYISQFVILVLVSIGLFKLIEEPANNYIRKKFAAG